MQAGIMEIVSIGATPALPESPMAVRAACVEFISPARVASDKSINGDDNVTALPQKRTTCGIQLMGGAMLMSAESYEVVLAKWRAALTEEFHARKSAGLV